MGTTATGDTQSGVLDFIKDDALRNWVMRHTTEGGFASHEAFIEHLVRQVYLQTGAHLEVHARPPQDWRRQVEHEKEPAQSRRIS